ncbi:MAG: uracil-DNA glycosylase [Verrucomicrobiales bacterium]
MSDSIPPAVSLRLLYNYLRELADSGVVDVLLTENALGKLRTLTVKPGQQIPASENKTLELAALREHAENSQSCRSLGTLRSTMVFSVGNPDARIAFIGEAPGAEEEKQRKPFVGPAGKLLTRIIETMGMSRTDVYIANILKFRPRISDADQGVKNRKPSAEEIAASIQCVRDEIDVVRPELIIALGGSAMQALLGLDGGVNRARGKLYDLGAHKAIVTYHPSYLLRSGSNSDKRKLWEDMLMAMNYLGMPVSAKQKNYFKDR